MRVVTATCLCGRTYRLPVAFNGKALECECGRRLTLGRAGTPSAEAPRIRDSPPPQHVARRRPPPRVVASALAGIAIGTALLSAVLRDAPMRPVPRRASASQAGVPRASVPLEPYSASNAASRATSAGVAASADALAELECLAASTQPRSSYEVGGRFRGGLGRLRVRNGTGADAVANLVDAGTRTPRRAIYIRSGEVGVMTQIPPGTYQLQFQLGTGWANRRFCSISGTSEFDEGLAFTEYPTERGVGYREFEMTLHPVAGGNAHTNAIAPAAFVLPAP